MREAGDAPLKGSLVSLPGRQRHLLLLQPLPQGANLGVQGVVQGQAAACRQGMCGWKGDEERRHMQASRPGPSPPITNALPPNCSLALSLPPSPLLPTHAPGPSLTFAGHHLQLPLEQLDLLLVAGDEGGLVHDLVACHSHLDALRPAGRQADRV